MAAINYFPKTINPTLTLKLSTLAEYARNLL